MITILAISKQIELSKYKTKYWLELLKIEPVKKDGRLFFPDGSISLLNTMKKIVDSGIAPAAAAVEVKTTYADPIVETTTKTISNDVLIDRIGNLENAVLMLVTENQNLKAQNTTILSKLNTLSINLLPTRQTIAFKAWQPPIKQSLKVSFIKRLWLELFNPESLRATS